MAGRHPPDPALAIANYRRLALHYDRATRRAAPVRVQTIAALDLRPGETVLDVACGSGLSLPLLEAQVGPSGRIIGVDLSPDMLELAEHRVEAHGWRNVTLLCGAMDEVRLPVRWDAALFHYTQDVLRSRAALANIFAQANAPARVALAGTKLFPWWLAPLNLYVWLANWSYMTTFEGLGRPWSLLQRAHVPDLTIRQIWLGASYVASGRVRGSGAKPR